MKFTILGEETASVVLHPIPMSAWMPYSDYQSHSPFLQTPRFSKPPRFSEVLYIYTYTCICIYIYIYIYIDTQIIQKQKNIFNHINSYHMYIDIYIYWFSLQSLIGSQNLFIMYCQSQLVLLRMLCDCWWHRLQLIAAATITGIMHMLEFWHMGRPMLGSLGFASESPKKNVQ